MNPLNYFKLSTLPNLCTFSALAAAFIALIFIQQAQFIYAFHAILIAAIFDSLDGRIARLTQSNSSFGAELDSLSDLIAFGLVPAYWGFFLIFDTWGWYACLPTFGYLAATATRLARFNTMPQPKLHFIGMPCPTAGILLSSCFIYLHHHPPAHSTESLIIACLCVLMSYLQLSHLKFPNFKHNTFSSNRWIRFALLCALVLLIACILWTPYITILILGLIYILGSLYYTLRL